MDDFDTELLQQMINLTFFIQIVTMILNSWIREIDARAWANNDSNNARKNASREEDPFEMMNNNSPVFSFKFVCKITRGPPKRTTAQTSNDSMPGNETATDATSGTTISSDLDTIIRNDL